MSSAPSTASTWLMDGSTSQVRTLSIEEVSGIHFRGVSYLGISRVNPTKKAEYLDNVLSSLSRLGITRLVTIVVGHAMGARMTTDLVSRAVGAAVCAKRPRPGLIHHSERG